MNRGNAAYDLSKYENAAPKLTDSEKSKIVVRKAKPKPTASAPKILITAVMAVLVLSLVVYPKVQQATVMSDINKLNDQVMILESENVRMQTAIESKSALKAVEDYAVDVLGMQKLDKSQIEYLSIENGNVIDIPEENENFFVKIKHSFEDFLEYLRG
ncbi:MAG: hypothetical protein MRZ39_06685 [Oscillospiraceae bacterium]|nr:hypothetical protein [Oscillospiraceae bacterium]